MILMPHVSSVRQDDGHADCLSALNAWFRVRVQYSMARGYALSQPSVLVLWWVAEVGGPCAVHEQEARCPRCSGSEHHLTGRKLLSLGMSPVQSSQRMIPKE